MKKIAIISALTVVTALVGCDANRPADTTTPGTNSTYTTPGTVMENTPPSVVTTNTMTEAPVAPATENNNTPAPNP